MLLQLLLWVLLDASPKHENGLLYLVCTLMQHFS